MLATRGTAHAEEPGTSTKTIEAAKKAFEAAKRSEHSAFDTFKKVSESQEKLKERLDDLIKKHANKEDIESVKAALESIAEISDAAEGAHDDAEVTLHETSEVLKASKASNDRFE
jgi:soluble cytochrome b562